MALMMLASLTECVELNVFPFGEIVNGTKTDKIIEPLKHYRLSDTLSIDVATQGSERKVTFTGRQWYVNGDTVIQEMKFNGDEIINLIKYNESGYYESWQKVTNEAMVHRIGLRCDNSMTWHSELIIGNKLCKMIEI